jgi:hypothetical protein
VSHLPPETPHVTIRTFLFPPSLQEGEAPPALTDAERDERERLMTEGFVLWNKRDFQNFLRGCVPCADSGR